MTGLNYPTGVVVIASGTAVLFVSDDIGLSPCYVVLPSMEHPCYLQSDLNSNTIRQVVIATGTNTTVAGTGSVGSLDGTGTNAGFSGPRGIAVNSAETFALIVSLFAV